jgi:aspartyl/glutamyl-tRNA(Asn/Gln) amidotransferase C subunit
VNVDGVKPSAHAFPVFAELRDDIAGPTLDLESLRRNAPAWKDDCIVVPRVVDDGN